MFPAPHGIVGAFHAPLAELLREFEIGAEPFGHVPELELRGLAGRHGLILSVNLAKMASTETGSHLVLVTNWAAGAYQVLDNACILSISGTTWLDSETVSKISNGKGLIIRGMPSRRGHHASPEQ